MRGNGWDDYPEEGIAELRRMASSKTFAALNGQRHLLEVYADIYAKGTEGEIAGTTFYPAGPPCKAAKRTSKNVRALKKDCKRILPRGRQGFQHPYRLRRGQTNVPPCRATTPARHGHSHQSGNELPR